MASAAKTKRSATATRASGPAERELLERLVSEPRRAQPTGIALGTLVALERAGTARVRLGGDAPERGVRARCAVSLGLGDVGREVVVALPDGADRAHADPIVLGVLRDAAAPAPAQPEIEARLDGARVVIEAEREIELRCGDASLVLTADGKVRIHGKDVLSRSSGGQRIKGATVRIN